MIDTGKVGGLLVEAADDVVIIGCGLNLWWPQPPTGFAGVLATDPGSAAAAEVAPGWADEVVRALSRTAGEWDRAGYVAVCETIGQEITWAPNGAGVAVDIDATGGLVVDTPAGRTTLRSGSVRSVRDATLAADPPGEGSQT
jgi:BirA family biotin operon repressor/biotin-[acetyl-CoA-carboxylase] ligase